MDSSSGSEYLPSQEVESSVMQEAKSQEEEGKEEDGTEAEEHIDLTFQIPEDTMRAAMLASENTRASFWSTKMYRGPHGQSIATHYCRSKEIAERVAQYFLKEKVVGFDIEWKPFSSPYDLKKNASLIQLACEDRIALFHISQFPGTTAEQLMPPSLKAVLETPDIYKVGVAVKGDFSRLQKYLNIQPQGVFELSRLHNLVELHSTSPTKLSNKLVSLANQVLQHLQLPLYKGAPLAGEPMDMESVRESDWSKPLDKQQIHYAAADAYAGFRLYHILEWKRKQLRPTPPTRGICDYDSKRDPKAKASKKKAAKTKKALKDTVAQSTVAVEPDDEADQDAEQDAVAETEEIDEEEEDVGYSTAPEEPTDSSNPEDPPPRPTIDFEPSTVIDVGAADGDIRTQRRVGRVNLSWLRGPDPEYPVLPWTPDNDNAPQKYHHEDDSATHPDTVHNAIRSSDPHFPMSETLDDEFADPGLEKVLQTLDLAESAFKSSTLSVTSTSDTETFDNLPSHLEADQTIANSSPKNENVAPATDDTFHTSEYNVATTWAQNYLHSTIPSPSSTKPSRIRATVPHLRAYHMWHVQELSLDTISGHLRDPPLAHSTVTGYILQAISLECLEYDKDAMRDIMAELPKGLKLGRWKWMAEKLGLLK
ncbi:ribonuclease H-like domain-containing protein [Ampelomyces quisqualis]|uniref:Ribonuclease H-like domain-containing protein n=1 Tax=Ampelomyces quisqualis TaxID=50730 RepID=A0A6A5QHI9_AMPQU|nr:ribonuclease H-like domain-containing protein [Ampelomyces quisqualis]